MAGAALYMMLSPDATVAAVLLLCKELCSKSDTVQRFRGTVRPVSFTLADGRRLDWDPATEVMRELGQREWCSQQSHCLLAYRIAMQGRRQGQKSGCLPS